MAFNSALAGPLSARSLQCNPPPALTGLPGLASASGRCLVLGLKEVLLWGEFSMCCSGLGQAVKAHALAQLRGACGCITAPDLPLGAPWILCRLFLQGSPQCGLWCFSSSLTCVALVLSLSLPLDGCGSNSFFLPF